MNTNSQKRAHRTPIYRRPAVIITFLGILVVVAAVVMIIFMNLDSNPSESDMEGNESSDTTISENNTTSTENSSSEDDGWERKVTMYEGEDANANYELTGSILRKEVDDSTKTLSVYAMIDQYLSEPGTCTILLKKSDNVVYRTEVTAEADITTSVCDPIEISTAQLAPGVYELEIQLSGNNKTGLIKEEVNL